VVGLFGAGCLVLAGGAFAQSLAAEATAGYAGFVDDATISHVVVGWDLVSGFGWELHTRV